VGLFYNAPEPTRGCSQDTVLNYCLVASLMHCSCCCISAGGDNTWIISAEDRAKHNAQFDQLKPVNGFVTGINIFAYYLYTWSK